MVIDRSALDRAWAFANERFRDVDNVLGARPGFRVRGGKPTNERVLVVLVRKKVAHDRLEPHEQIPHTIAGVPVDVRELDAAMVGRANHGTSTFGIDFAKLHDAHSRRLAREHRVPAAPPLISRVGHVVVMEDNNTLVTGGTGAEAIDWARAYNYFRGAGWGDDYDFVSFYVDRDSGMPDLGRSWGGRIANTVTGIGQFAPFRDATYNSSRLEGVSYMLPADDRRVRLHETGHRWLAYADFRASADAANDGALRLPDGSHWSEAFDNDQSPMDYDLIDWVANSDGTFTKVPVAPGSFRYCRLDRYLMGFLPPDKVGGFFYLTNVQPTGNGTYTATRHDLTVANIVWAVGERNPTSASADRTLRQAFVVLTNNLAQGEALATNVNAWREQQITDFRDATSDDELCGAVLDTYLYTNAYDGVYIADNEADIGVGVEPSSGGFWDSPDIWVRNADDDGTEHQAPIRGRDNFLRVRVRNRCAVPTSDVTVNLYNANFIGTEFVYPDDWKPSSRLGTQTFASIPANGEVIAHFTWPSAAVPDASWHPCLLAEVLPIHRHLTKPRHVWEDRRIAQKNITIVEPPKPRPVPSDPPPEPGPEEPDDPCAVPFRVGATTHGSRWIGVSVRQVEGDPTRLLALELGAHDWTDRLHHLLTPSIPGAPTGFGHARVIVGGDTSLQLDLGGSSVTIEVQRGTELDVGALAGARVLPAQGGHIAFEHTVPRFVVAEPLRGGTVWLPLRAGDRPVLLMRRDCDDKRAARFEVTQRDTSGRIVGGFNIVVRARHER